jgi:hypothetical protein
MIRIILATIALCFVFFSCKKKADCPECFDEQMQCIRNTCACPEGALETTLDFPIKGVYERHCIVPTPLTFLAQIPMQYGCIDTFAISFTEEPYGTNRTIGQLNNMYSAVRLEMPEKRLRRHTPSGMVYSDGSRRMTYINGLYPTVGANNKCWFFSVVDGEKVHGYCELNFIGEFVHKDTIRGNINLVFLDGHIPDSVRANRNRMIKLVRMVQ